MLYYPHTSTSAYSGTYGTAYSIVASDTPVTGTICQPGDVIELSVGESITFFSSNLTITASTSWTLTDKYNWFDSYLKFVNLYNDSTLNNVTYTSLKNTPAWYTAVFNYAESINLFDTLSIPQIAYCNLSSTSGEVSVGCVINENKFIFDYVNTLPTNDPLRIYVYLFHKTDEVYVSNIIQLTYQSFTKFVWCFGGYTYNNIGFTLFGEIKLAGNGIKTHYIVKKNIDIEDPTLGLCSGIKTTQFCMGDIITIIDDSILSTNSTSGWSFVADPISEFPFSWYIADITNPCLYYSNYYIEDMYIPFRVIDDCTFNDFT